MAPARPVWRWALASSLLAAACGGAPAAPSPPPSPSAPVALAAGAYDLTLSASGDGGPVLCLSVGGANVDANLTVGVQLEARDAVWVASADNGDLTLTLTASGGTLAGTLGGSAGTGDGSRVIVDGTSDGNAQVSGLVQPNGDVAGDVSGRVTFMSGSSGVSCSKNGWRLSAR